MTIDEMEDQERRRVETVAEFMLNRRLAHAMLFKHRHPAATPAFHWDIIDLIHSDLPNVLILAFRGSGKSTLQEEATVIGACLGEFHNKVILGSTRQRAIDRLTAIKYELEYNETLRMLFGDMKGHVWNEDRIVTSNNICIQAFGPGMSFRGVKFIEWRPDRLDLDDLEDEETIRDTESRAALRSWLRRVVFPALAPNARTRVYATPLDPDALPMHLMRSEAWVHRVYPLYSVAPDGERLASWPGLYPLEWVDRKEQEYRMDGASQEFAQEYQCQPEDPATKVFTESMLKVEPQIRTWHAVYAAYDPARSIGQKSATTGYCVFSWVGRRLVIWRGGAGLWLPDQIVDDIVQTNETYRPVAIGVENAGLVEFIDQPLRQKAAQLGTVLPVVPLKPPRGKLQFIQSLQPYFRAGEIVWAGAIDGEARAQLLAFPRGKIDFPNALAYALYLRPGQPVYEGFGVDNVVEELPVVSGEPLFLAVNATPQFTTGVLIQVVGTALRVVRDWVREGGPGENLAAIVTGASLETGRAIRLRCPPAHFSEYDTIGLRAAAGQVPVELIAAGNPVQGREMLRALMTRQKQGRSLLTVATTARWTLNAFAGGLAYGQLPGRTLTSEPVAGPYRVLAEGLESLAAVMDHGQYEEERHYATTRQGRKYLTSMADDTPLQPVKSEWHLDAEARPSHRMARR